MCLGLLSHCRGCMSKSSVASILPCLVSWCHCQSLRSPETSFVQYHVWGPHLLRLKKAATKVVRPSSWWPSLEVHRWSGPKWKDWGSSTSFCYHVFVHEDNSITIVLRSQTLTFHVRVWLCKNTILIDKLATVPRLDIHRNIWAMLLYLFIKRGEITALEIH